jgi:MYXO-CTERM domain-containing protein
VNRSATRVSTAAAVALAGSIAFVAPSIAHADAGTADSGAEDASARDAASDVGPDATEEMPDVGALNAAYGCASAPAGSAPLGASSLALLALAVTRRRRG